MKHCVVVVVVLVVFLVVAVAAAVVKANKITQNKYATKIYTLHLHTSSQKLPTVFKLVRIKALTQRSCCTYFNHCFGETCCSRLQDI